MYQQTPRELLVVSHSRKLLESPDAAAWLATRLATTTERRAAESVVFVDADYIHPVVGAMRHDKIVRFHSDGTRRSRDDTARRTWHRPEHAPGAPGWCELRAGAIVEAAGKASAAGWNVRWVVLMHPDDPSDAPARLLHPIIPPGPREAHVDTYAPPREERSVVWLDTETTGTNPARHAVIEYAAIVTSASSREVRRTIERRVKIPEWAEVVPEALDKNGYNRELWRDALEPREAFAELRAWLPESFTLAGYSVAFDRRFLAAEFARHGLAEPGWKHLHVDPLYTARRTLKATGRVSGCKLTDLCTYFGIDTGRAHTAMADTEAARQVYLRMVDNGNS